MKNKKTSIVFLAVVTVIMYLPILMVILYSFNASKLTATWTGFSLKWYEALFRDREIKKALYNSILLAGASCVCSAVIGTLGALGNHGTHSRIKSVVEYIATLPIMIPEIILGMVFLAFFGLLRLAGGMPTLIIAHTAFCIPYIYMMVKARLVGMDAAFDEAARDLGATPLYAFFTITLPLIFPAVLSGALLAFAMSFDDVIISIFVTGPKVNTLPIIIYTQMKNGVTPEINALCTLMLAATISVIIIAGALRRIKSGGAEKL